MVKKRTKKKRTRKTTSKKTRTTTAKYVVEATVRMKSKKLTKAQADDLKAQTKRKVKGATVVVRKA